MSRLYEGEPLGRTSTLSPRRFSLEMWEGSLSWWGKSRRSEREVDYPTVLFKNLRSYRGLSHDFFCRCAEWILLGGHFQSLPSDGVGFGNEIVGGSRAVGIFGVSDCLLAAKFKWSPWKHTPRARASTKEVIFPDSRASFALARPANLLIQQGSLSWSVVKLQSFPFFYLQNFQIF